MVETTPDDGGNSKPTDVLEDAIARNPNDPRLELVTVHGPCHCVREGEPRPEWDKHHRKACGSSPYTGTCTDEPVEAWADNPLYERQVEEVIKRGQ